MTADAFIYIFHMIENLTKDQLAHSDTASSEWTTYPKSTPESHISQPSVEPTRNQPIEGLEEQAIRVQTLLEHNKFSLQQLQHNSKLANYIEETQTEVDILRRKNAQGLGQVKKDFDEGTSDLQKRIDWWRREHKKCKTQAEEQIQEAMHDLKTIKDVGEKTISEELRKVGGDCRQKLAVIGRDVREWKREGQLGRERLFDQLEAIRCGLEAGLEQQKTRRNQYDSIVVELLERTCEQGERLLRRIC